MARQNKTFTFLVTINCIYYFKVSKSAAAVHEGVIQDSVDGTIKHQLGFQ